MDNGESIVRYQTKDTRVGLPLLRGVLSDFHEAHRLYPGQWSRYVFVASHCVETLDSLNSDLERLYADILSYGKANSYAKDTYEDVRERLVALGIEISVDFLYQYVQLQLHESLPRQYHTCIQFASGVLLLSGIAPGKERAAAHELLLLISHSHQKRVSREDINDALASYYQQLRRKAPAPVQVSPPVQVSGIVQGLTRLAKRPTSAVELAWRLIVVPGGASIIELPGGHSGLVDCGRRAARSVLGYLQFRGIRRLSFIAITHWHRDHYDGFPAVLSGLEGVDGALLPNPSLMRCSASQGMLPAGIASWNALWAMLRNQEKCTRLMVASDGVRHFGVSPATDDANITLTSIGPTTTDIMNRKSMLDHNRHSIVYRLAVAGRSVLIPGDATVQAWEDVLCRADETHWDAWWR